MVPLALTNMRSEPFSVAERRSAPKTEPAAASAATPIKNLLPMVCPLCKDDWVSERKPSPPLGDCGGKISEQDHLLTHPSLAAQKRPHPHPSPHSRIRTYVRKSLERLRLCTHRLGFNPLIKFFLSPLRHVRCPSGCGKPTAPPLGPPAGFGKIPPTNRCPPRCRECHRRRNRRRSHPRCH